MGILTSIIVISFLIFFHELGHYLAARFFGVKVERFSIGFGNVIAKKRFFDTEWAISSIPLGGYVKMKGQDDLKPLAFSAEDDSYSAKKPWQRIVILAAGPFANVFLAFLLYLAAANIGVMSFAPVIGKIMPNTPAAKSGLKEGDRILQIEGLKIKSWDEISKAIKTIPKKTLLFVVKRKEKLLKIYIAPRYFETKNIFREKVRKKMIGISPKGEVVVVKYRFIGGVLFALAKTKEASLMIIKGIEKLIMGVVSVKEIGGVISIVDITAKASSVGMSALFMLSALISVNLGILNLLPIPALDGGHILFNIYEMLFKKTPSQEVIYKLTVMGWIILASLMSLGIYNDLNRLFGAGNG